MKKLIATMLVLVTLTASTKSLADGTDTVDSDEPDTEVCYNPKQMQRLNLYRIECEKAKADLTTTIQAMKVERDQNPSTDSSMVVVVGIGGLILGAVLCTLAKC